MPAKGKQKATGPPSQRQLYDSDDASLASESPDEFASTSNGQANHSRYLGESELEDEVEGSDESMEDGSLADEEDLQQSLASLPMSALLRARKALGAAPSKPRQDDDSSASDAPEDGDADESTLPRGKRKGRLEMRHEDAQKALAVLDRLKARDERNQTKARERKQVAHRNNKHAPMEMTSKRAVTRAREVVEVPRLVRRDPRFDSLSGALDEDLYSRSYSFISEQQKAELAQLKTTVYKARKVPNFPVDELEELERALKKMESLVDRAARDERERTAVKKWREQETGKQNSGKAAWHLKQADRRQLIEREKLSELAKDKRKQRKYTERKTLKESQKAKKRLPPLRSART
ncbi:uncharacterized protein L969DRAFT_16615 [Mixia osmundae IAM 14324]|uniref:rRNA biogenesis protein RRP36 n=1 Tax=Mixia osmundae (strain CBS 9802 / IAM 14324 / JCM 22182 / KY 12970) TaxID=764103 RepID=G7E9J2_MIXOS|nr:uncharacterized protein L969DRAFT_16615 [Mixia osmundae IAM 14324]KEI39943.1 hypothetical protein L969DRAFT_16615 [Mixia osmundae IAM 14324]GAA99311.1 hypothetical protein E5Q_06006 [Mixia osmundae IAM 14324]